MAAMRRLVPGALATALLVGACEKSTAPTTTDPTTMATAVSGMSSTLMQNSALISLNALLYTPGFAGAAMVAATAPAAQPGTAGGGGGATAALRTASLMRSMALARPAALQALFPANILGKTFQWDATTVPPGYRIKDSTYTLPGAPAVPSNGVRFILYQVDTASGMPNPGLQTTGYVDLADVSTAAANALHIVVHVASGTAADYTISEVRTTTTLTLSTTGYVQDVLIGGPQINFDLNHAFTLADSSLADTFDLSGNGATVTMMTTVSASGAEVFDWTFSKNGTVELVGSGTDTTFDAQVKLNGTLFAKISGTPNAPTITDANGNALTATETLALYQIVVGFYSVYWAGTYLVFAPGILLFG